MLRICIEPDLMRDLLGLPQDMTVSAIEWRQEMASFIVYAYEDGMDDGILIPIDHPTFQWKSNTKMRLPNLQR